MHETVDHRRGDDFVVEDLAPPPERHVRGDQDRALLIPVRDQMEEQVRLIGMVEHAGSTQRGFGQWQQEQVDSEFYAIISDLAGTPTELVDPDLGTLAGQATTTLWGHTHWAGTSTDLRFAGQHYDPETGLHYNRYRYYNPTTSTYTTPDPLGIAPNPTSATAYVHNPHTWTDPLGLKCGEDGLNEHGAELDLKYGDDWTSAQRVAADGKVESLNKADLVKTS